MEGTSPHPTCLFVGAPDVGKFTLIRALQPCTEPKSPSPANYSLRLDTKYYTADVAVRAITTQQQDQQQQLPPDAWEQLQALVLVFDANSQASFASVQSWANARDTDSIEVKLLVANKADSLQQHSAAGASALSCRPQWLQEAMAWCVDEGYEYVEAAAGKPAVDVALQLDGEQQGAARVLAALQAHMWPGMVKKDWQPRVLPDVGGGAATATAVGAGVGSSSSGSKDQGSPAPAAAADAVAAAAGSTAGATPATAAPAAADGSMVASNEQQQQQEQQHADMQLLQGSGAVGGKTAPHRQPQHGAAAAAAASPADEDETDLDLDDFEQMMKQLQGELSNSVSSNTNWPYSLLLAGCCVVFS